MQFSEKELIGEVWLDVPDFKNLYQASSLGRVKSLDRYVIVSNGNSKKVKGRVLKLQKRFNYLKIDLYKNGKYKTFSIQRLIMLTFKGDSELVVDHINGNTLNNRLNNLQYLTHRDNVSKGMVDKTSIYTGVYWDKSKLKWRSNLRIDTIGYSLGCFDSEEEASNVYQENLLNYLQHNVIPVNIKRTKIILNLQSGVFHESLKEASLTYSICNKYLSLMLTNKRKNKTSLIYA
jgi:hypothetical protein